MTPEERALVTELFDRLAALEDAQRDPQAERLIRDGLRQAPNAVYALVQTALVQEEAHPHAEDQRSDGGRRDALVEGDSDAPAALDAHRRHAPPAESQVRLVAADLDPRFGA